MQIADEGKLMPPKSYLVRAEASQRDLYPQAERLKLYQMSGLFYHSGGLCRLPEMKGWYVLVLDVLQIYDPCRDHMYQGEPLT